MSHEVRMRLSKGLWQALHEHCARTGESVSHAISAALAEALDVEHHTIYQVSTSGALVKGVFQGCVRIGDIRRHGDFGLGTFEGLDGEAILLNGACWQAKGDGSLCAAPDEALAPFFVATHFHADQTHILTDVRDWADLTRRIDGFRRSANMFAAVHLRGLFERIKYRVARKSEPGAGLVDATSHQAEFMVENVRGDLVGFWTPAYVSTINVPGYHLHFLSEDRRSGGHVLDIAAARLELDLHLESNLHLILPETPAFLAADLSGDPTTALAKAEGGDR